MTERVVTQEEYELIVDQMRPQSIEQEGVVDRTAFAAMVRDPATVFVPDKDRLVPVLTPAANLTSYVNLAYYHRLPGIGEGPAYYYLHLEHLRRSNAAAYAASLRPAFRELAALNGQILYDFPLSRRATDGQVGRLIEEIGGVCSRHLIDPRANHPRHYHFASPVKLVGRSALHEPLHPLDLYELAAQHPHKRVEILRALLDADIHYVWPYYAARHEGELDPQDPVAAGFHEADFRDICVTPGYVKAVCRDGTGQIIHMLVVTPVQNCPWLNQRQFERLFPEEYAASRILCGIVAVRKPRSPGGALSLLTLGQIHRLIAIDGQRTVEVGAFDEVSFYSARQLTQLSQKGTGVTVDFEHPSGHHVFRARQLHAV